MLPLIVKMQSDINAVDNNKPDPNDQKIYSVKTEWSGLSLRDRAHKLGQNAYHRESSECGSCKLDQNSSAQRPFVRILPVQKDDYGTHGPYCGISLHCVDR